MRKICSISFITSDKTTVCKRYTYACTGDTPTHRMSLKIDIIRPSPIVECFFELQWNFVENIETAKARKIASKIVFLGYIMWHYCVVTDLIHQFCFLFRVTCHLLYFYETYQYFEDYTIIIHITGAYFYGQLFNFSKTNILTMVCKYISREWIKCTLLSWILVKKYCPNFGQNFCFWDWRPKNINYWSDRGCRKEQNKYLSTIIYYLCVPASKEGNTISCPVLNNQKQSSMIECCAILCDKWRYYARSVILLSKAAERERQIGSQNKIDLDKFTDRNIILCGNYKTFELI